MDNQADQIKQKIDIVSVISERINLKKAGRNFKANCPFHSEKTPSFMVSPELQIYKCFGCGETGDVYTFLEKYEGMDFKEALRYLAEKTGVKLVSYKPQEESLKEKLYNLNKNSQDFYHYILMNHPVAKTARDYLINNRGLTQKTINTFKIGYSPDVFGVLKKFLVDKKGFAVKDLELGGLGFVKGGNFIDKFRGRITFPLYDHRGNVVGFSGRILPQEKNKELAKYINSPETPIYHKSRLLFGLHLVKDDIKKTGEVIIVEGETDMISSWQAGITNIVAIKGSALTDDQLRLLSRFCKKITLALDSDLAGNLAARRGIVLAQKQGFDISVAGLGKYKDPDEAARADVGFYKKALEEAEDVWSYIIQSVFSRFETDTPEGKAKISRELVPLLASIPDKIVQAHYIQKVTERLLVPSEAVYAQMEQYSQESAKENEEKRVVSAPDEIYAKNRRQILEERLLTIAFQRDPQVLFDKEILDLIKTPLASRILNEYQNFSAKHKEFNPSAFAEILPKELFNGFAEMALRDIQDLPDNPSIAKKEIEVIKNEIRIFEIRHKLEFLGTKIRVFESAGENKKLDEAKIKFQKLTQKLADLSEIREKSIILEGWL